MPSSEAEHRVFHSGLADRARAMFGARCPCCGNPMHEGRVRKRNAAAQNRRDRASVAHDIPVSMGGNPAVWVWACRGCNNDQGAMSFRFWARRLELDGDPRAERVRALAAFVEDWCAAAGVKRRFHRRGGA